MARKQSRVFQASVGVGTFGALFLLFQFPESAFWVVLFAFGCGLTAGLAFEK